MDLLLEPAPVFMLLLARVMLVTHSLWAPVPAALLLSVTLGRLLICTCVLIWEMGIWHLSP